MNPLLFIFAANFIVQIDALKLIVGLQAHFLSCRHSARSSRHSYNLDVCRVHPHANPRRDSRLFLSASDVAIGLYDFQLEVSNFIESELTEINAVSLILLYGFGFFSALSPCTFSMLPLTVAYLGGSDIGGDKKQNESWLKTLCYTLGLAGTFSALGWGAASFGTILGSNTITTYTGNLPQLLIAVLYLIIGFNLLEIVQINFPSFSGFRSLYKGNEHEDRSRNANLEAVIFGATSALIATPCTSPILTALLTFVSSSATPISGALFLFVFSLGYASPVASAGLASSRAINTVLASGSPWVINAFASLLISYGSYQLLYTLSTIAA